MAHNSSTGEKLLKDFSWHLKESAIGWRDWANEHALPHVGPSYLKSDNRATGQAIARALVMCILLILCLKGRTAWMSVFRRVAVLTQPDPCHLWDLFPVYTVVLSLSLGSTQIPTLPILCIPEVSKIQRHFACHLWQRAYYLFLREVCVDLSTSGQFL